MRRYPKITDWILNSPLKSINVLILILYYSCAPSSPPKTVVKAIKEPPMVISISPSNKSILTEIIKIEIGINNIPNVEEITFFINDSSMHTDRSIPFNFQWNTSQYLDNSEHSFYALIRNQSEEIIKSEIYTYLIDNEKSRPKMINTQKIEYSKDRMNIIWNQSKELDFYKYELLRSNTSQGPMKLIKEFYQIGDTTHTLTSFDPTIENWFWINVIDTIGLTSIGEGSTNKVDSPPDAPFLNLVSHRYGKYFLSWKKSKEKDFKRYLVYNSDSKLFDKKKIITQLEDPSKTNIAIQIDSLKYYQIETEDIWGLKTKSNIILGDFEHMIWGETFSVYHTTKIDLSSNQISGIIPKSIGYLSNLTHLSLNANYLSGEIPSEIGELKKLIFLDLSHNRKLNGEIPAEIGKIKHLQQLYINGTSLSGNIPINIYYLKKLTYLGLSDNKLSGHLPYEIGELVAIKYLNLWNNNFHGSIPTEISNLKSLRDLNLSENNFSGKIPLEIGKLESLETLSLFNNSLNGSVPSNIKVLKNLTYLSLYNNNFKGDINAWLLDMVKLNYLRLDGNNFEGQIPTYLCDINLDIENTEYFNFSGNNFCPPFPTCIKNNIGIQKKCE